MPYGNKTLLGRLAEEVKKLEPGRIFVNVSRCADLISEELKGIFGKDPKILFEERPLGVVGTLERLSKEIKEREKKCETGEYPLNSQGTWIVLNTDMVIELDWPLMFRFHIENRSQWTVAAGEFPDRGSYGKLGVTEEESFGVDSDRTRHYLGVSFFERSVLELTRGHGGENLFDTIAPLARRKGLNLKVFESGGQWLDMGQYESLRANILSGGNYISPEAFIPESAVLEGINYIGKGCRIGEHVRIRNSVLLDGSEVSGGELTNSICCWNSMIRGV